MDREQVFFFIVYPLVLTVFGGVGYLIGRSLGRPISGLVCSVVFGPLAWVAMPLWHVVSPHLPHCRTCGTALAYRPSGGICVECSERLELRREMDERRRRRRQSGASVPE